jgi:hypothetical protein
MYPQSERVLALTTAHQAEYTYLKLSVAFSLWKIVFIADLELSGLADSIFPCLC